MDDIQAGARAPDQPGPAKQAATQAAGAAGQAAGDVAGTAKDQARQVAGEVKTQARSVAADVRNRVSDQASTQNEKLASGIRRIADELEQMASERDDSPARQVVTRVAGSGRQMADYLAERGPEGVLREMQDFARRRPGAFLAAALVGGFVVGRLGKSMLNASSDSTGASSKPRRDAYVSDVPPLPASQSVAGYSTEPGYAAGYGTGAGYAAGTEYVSTGTGTAIPLEEPYPSQAYASDTYPQPVPLEPDPRAPGGQR